MFKLLFVSRLRTPRVYDTNDVFKYIIFAACIHGCAYAGARDITSVIRDKRL